MACTMRSITKAFSPSGSTKAYAAISRACRIRMSSILMLISFHVVFLGVMATSIRRQHAKIVLSDERQEVETVHNAAKTAALPLIVVTTTCGYDAFDAGLV